MICDRCGRETLCVTGSFFNTDLICPECDATEQAHPDYERARRIEAEDLVLELRRVADEIQEHVLDPSLMRRTRKGERP